MFNEMQTQIHTTKINDQKRDQQNYYFFLTKQHNYYEYIYEKKNSRTMEVKSEEKKNLLQVSANLQLQRVHCVNH